MTEIERCPFCGGEANTRWFAEHDSVQCDKCGLVAILPQHGCGNEHTAAWNRRADARQHALKTGVCPMCEDCPDGCPVEIPSDSRNIVTTNADRIRSMGGKAMRLIDADAIVKCFDPNTWQGEMMIAIVNGLSTIDPVKHGEWVAFDPLNMERPYNWVCSSCGYGCVDYRTTYCHDCGAKMEDKS